MRARRGVAAACVLAVSLLGCASSSAPHSVGVRDASEAKEKARPKRDMEWSRPIGMDGLAVNQAQAKSAGRLRFDPRWPSFPVKPALIEVTRPNQQDHPYAGYVGIRYDFPAGSDGFWTDERVVVVHESISDIDVTELGNIGRGGVAPEPPPGMYQVKSVNGHPYLLVTADDRASVMMLVDGLKITIQGPSLKADLAEQLAARL